MLQVWPNMVRKICEKPTSFDVDTITFFDNISFIGDRRGGLNTKIHEIVANETTPKCFSTFAQPGRRHKNTGTKWLVFLIHNEFLLCANLYGDQWKTY